MGLLGRHGPRQTVEQLIDLDDFSAPRGRYSLRPSYIRVEASPELMRAPRSVWARWIKALGWSVPPELELEPSGSVAKGAVSDDCDPIEALIAFAQRHRLELHGYRLPPYLGPTQVAPAGSGARQQARLKSSGAEALRSAIERTIAARGWPGRDVPWGKFYRLVRSDCQVSERAPSRGYGDKSRWRAVKALEAVRGSPAARIEPS